MRDGMILAWLMSQLSNVFYLVALVTAIALAGAWWQRRGAGFVMAGALTLLLGTLGFSFINIAVMPAMRLEHGWSITTFGTVAGIIGCVHSLVSATGISLLVAAAFMNQPAKK